ncbi:MAG: CHASE domain-containing protein [Kiloniellales bacterium]|nr:CHASE domain-containing protein [Kiloniellales bacterium]
MSAGLVWLLLGIDLNNAELSLREESDLVRDQFLRRASSTDAVLTALVGIHHASDDLRPYEFTAFSQELLSTYPHIQLVTQLAKVSAAEREAFVAEVREDGFPQFEIRDFSNERAPVRSESRPYYLPFHLLVPMEPESARLLGFDARSIPALVDAIERAVDSGKPAASLPLALFEGRQGLFILKPIYQGQQTPRSSEERRRQWSGLIALHLDAERFLGDIGVRYNHLDIEIRHLDGAGQPAPIAFYTRPARIAPPAGSRLFPRLVYEERIWIQDAPYLLRIATQPGFEVVRWWLLALLFGFVVVSGVSVAIAVIHRRRAHVQLQDSERQLRQIIDLVPQRIFARDRRGKVILANRASAEAFGRPSDERQADRSGTQSPHGGGLQGDLLEVIERGQPKVIEEDIIVDASGRSRVFHTTNLPFRPADSSDIGVLTVSVEMTAQKQLEHAMREARDAAEHANHLKSEFLATMSHELRTPLNAIIGFSEIIRDQCFGTIENSRYLDYANDINESGVHLLEVINDILDLSKIEAGKLELSEEVFDLVAVVRACLALVAQKIRNGGLVEDHELPEGLPWLRGDERKVKQILLNLLTNSIKFTEPERKVGVSVKLGSDGALLLQVRDEGIGMSVKDIKIAFEPFRQIDGTHARNYEGTGLGLPLTKALAELHGATLELHSDLGEGTTATLRFPPERVVRDQAASIAG